MKRRALLALATAGALALTACGSDDATEETATSDPTTEATSDAPSDEMTEEMTSEPTEAMTSEMTEGVAADLPDPLVLTLTPSQETGGLIETAQPLADMLAEELGVTVEAQVPTDYAGVIAALESGQAHVAGGLGPLQMVQAEAVGSDLILQAERFGSYSYVTQWFTNDPDTYCADEPVEVEQDEGEPFLFCNGVDQAEDASEGPIGQDMLTNVEGQTVAFVDQGSTSGYAVPSLQLLTAGVDPINGIDSVFAGSHDNAVQAVYDGDATVGVSFNDARGQLVEQTPDVGQQVVVFGWSSAIPNDGFATSGEVSEEGSQAISDALQSICNDTDACDPDAEGVMYELYEIEGLQPVNSAEFDIIRDLQDQLADQLGLG